MSTDGDEVSGNTELIMRRNHDFLSVFICADSAVLTNISFVSGDNFETNTSNEKIAHELILKFHLIEDVRKFDTM